MNLPATVTIFDCTAQFPVGAICARLSEAETELPLYIDQLVESYALLHPEEEKRLNAALQQTGGYIDATVKAVMQEIGPCVERAASLQISDNYWNGWDSRVQALGEVFPAIQRLTLTKCAINAGDVVSIAKAFPKLEELDVSGNYCAHFSHDANFPNLRKLCWNSAHVSDRELIEMPVMPKLESLSIQGGAEPEYDNPFQRPMVELVRVAPNLVTLDLSHSSSLQLTHLQGIEQLTKLKTLIITGCTSIHGDAFEAFKGEHPEIQIVQ